MKNKLVLLLVLVVFLVSCQKYSFEESQDSILVYRLKSNYASNGCVDYEIMNETQCNQECTLHCSTIDKKIHHVDFEVRESGCNKCDCYCQRS